MHAACRHDVKTGGAGELDGGAANGGAAAPYDKSGVNRGGRHGGVGKTQVVLLEEAGGGGRDGEGKD